jgi:para-nitrobenzyl esterase
MYASGDFSHVPLLAGSNSEEGGYNSILGEDDPTIVNYKKALADRFGSNADEAFHFYPAASDGEAVKDAAQMLSSDLFIGYSTWKWVSLSSAKGNKPVFYYYYAHPRAPVRPEAQAYFDSWWQYNWHGKNYPRAKPRGAVHSAEIEYALGNLSSNSVYAWGPNDELMSKTAQAYFLNFIKTGSPNGKGVPNWPVYSSGKRMVLDVSSSAEPDGAAARYEFLEKTIFNKKK